MMTGFNIATVLAQAARAYPCHPAVVFGDDEWTYQQVQDRVKRLAGAWRTLGIQAGDRVAVLSPNRPQMLEAYFAAWWLGAVVVPLNFRLHREEVTYILQHSQAKALVFAGDYDADVDAIRTQCSDTKLWVSFDAPSDVVASSILSYEYLVQQGEFASDIAPVCGDDLAWLFYTSGTTGRPKGAMLTHRIVLLMTLNVCADLYPFSHEDVALHAAPLSHGSGLYSLALIAKGATNVVFHHTRFDPETVFAEIEHHRVTVLPFLAPTMVKRLVDFDRRTAYDVSSLRCVLYGGAPMYVEDIAAALDAFGPIFAQVYGQGECPMTITGMDRSAHDRHHSQRLGSVGTARLGVEVAVVDEQDKPVPSGIPGEVVVRSEMVMKGYWRDPVATQSTIVDGWLHTGDIGYLDEHGYLFLLDRNKDMIISGGSNIYPREVEEVLLRHPAVQEVCVFGVPDPEWGEAVKAVVVRRFGRAVSPDELIAFCQDHLASYKRPRSVDFVDALPKNAYGKVLKRELRAPYWANASRQI